MFDKRVVSAVVTLPLLFAVVILGGYFFFGGICILTFIGLVEYFNAVGNGNIKPMKFIGTLSGLLLILLVFNKDTMNMLMPVITLIILTLLSIPIFSSKYNFLGAGATIIGILYIPLFFGYIYLIRNIPNTGLYFVWFVFILSWVSDTFAYFIGKRFGKTKLSPVISPKKTVEGAVGGIIAGTLGCIAYGLILSSFNILNIPIIHLIIMGVLGSLISEVGDLAASSIKRNVGVKDYGKILPGHGGVLDRFDSILFVAPLIYYYITFYLI